MNKCPNCGSTLEIIDSIQCPNCGKTIHKIEMLSEPLITDDGFLNPVCMAELESRIKNMPPTYKRLAGEPEWTIQCCTTLGDICGNFIKSAFKAFDNTFPPNLEEMVGFLKTCLIRKMEKYYGMWYFNKSLCEINRLLWDILGNVKLFNEWNEKEIVGEHWIDLHALLHQVCICIRNERRHMKAFDLALEKENDL